MGDRQFDRYGKSGAQPSAGQGRVPAEPVAAHPAWWSTSALMTICGCVAWIALHQLCAWGLFGGVLGKLALASAGIAYALFCYPSYFTASPVFADANLASFLNTFLGGPVFGCAWNSSLTKRLQGASHFVCVLLLALYIVCVLLLIPLCMSLREQRGDL